MDESGNGILLSCVCLVTGYIGTASPTDSFTVSTMLLAFLKCCCVTVGISSQKSPTWKVVLIHCHDVLSSCLAQQRSFRFRSSCMAVTPCTSLVPRPFFAGEEKTAWYNLLAHAPGSPKSGDIGYACILSACFNRSPP